MTKKKLTVWEDTFNRFCDTHPQYADNIVDWYPSGCREITFKLKDDSRRTYNWITGRISIVYEPNIDDDFVDLTEEEVYRGFQVMLNHKMLDMQVSQESLSRETGISRVTISKYTNGKALPNYQNLRKICRVLKCSPTELYVYKF